MPIISLTPLSAEFPEVSNFPELKKDAQGRMVLAFDPTTKESACWSFACPAYTGTPDLIISYYMVSAVANTVDLDVEVEAIGDGDSTDMDAVDSFDTANSQDSVTVPSTAGYPDQITIALTNRDSMAADEMLRFRISRDAPNDDASGDLHFVMAHLKYN